MNAPARDRAWTADHDAVLLRMKEAGLTVSAIAIHIDRTPAAVVSRAYHLSVDQPRGRPKTTDRLGQRIEDYLARIARLNSYSLRDLKRECYGWR